MAFPLSWRERNQQLEYEQNIGSLLDGCDPFVALSSNEEMSLTLKVTGNQYNELFSALLTGVELTYPEKYLELIALFLQAAHCPPALPSENECFEYPPHAPFIDYVPQNPYNEPDLVPTGYLFVPINKFSDFSLIGWLSTWFPTYLESLTGYLPDDLIVDISSLPLLQAFMTEVSGLPQIEITVQGEGVAELHLLSFPLGGRIIVTVDEQPNLLDFFAGIGGNGVVIESERDLTSIPIENDATIIEEIEVTGSGQHVIYITFAPVINDSLIPIGFGGGFRKVVLCGFDELGVIMGITDLRRVGEKLEVFENGAWTEKVDLQPLHDGLQTQITNNDNDIANHITIYDQHVINNQAAHAIFSEEYDDLSDEIYIERLRIDSIALDIAQHNVTLSDHEGRLITLENLIAALQQSNLGIAVTGYEVSVLSTQSTQSNVHVIVPNSQQSHTFTYPNALIISATGVYNSYSDGKSYIKNRVGGVEGTNENRNYGQSRRTIYVSDVFTDIETGIPVDIELSFKANTAKTAKVSSSQRVMYTVLEFGDIDLPVINSVVTFDGGGYPYTISIIGTFPNSLGAGGNPDDCYRGYTMVLDDAIDIEINLGSLKTIPDISWDLWASDFSDVFVSIFFDGVPISISAGASGASQSWNSFLASEEFLNEFPKSAQVVKLRFESAASLSEMRIDNISVITS